VDSVKELEEYSKLTRNIGKEFLNSGHTTLQNGKAIFEESSRT
jgi:hypothetical protein